MEFGALAAYGGKTYLPVHLDAPDGLTLSVSARTTGGLPAPAKILRLWGHEDPVLVVPSLLATVRVAVVARNAAGEVVERVQRAVRPSAAFLTSLKNTQRNFDAVRWFLGADDVPSADTPFVSIETLATDYEREDVVHGFVEFCGSDPGALGRPFRVSVIDAFCRPIEGARFLILRDDWRRLEDGSHLRSVSYSLAIPHAKRSFTLWVRPGDHEQGSGFACADALRLRGLRDRAEGTRRARPDGAFYHDWFHYLGAPSGLELELERRTPPEGQGGVSVLVDNGAEDPGALAATLDALDAQTAGCWEAIVFGSAPLDGIWRVVGPAWRANRPDGPDAAPGPQEAPGTAAEALAMARGEWVSALEAGDVLEPSALHQLLAKAAGTPDAAMAYGDQDLLWLVEDGRARNERALLKPDFDRALLYASGYTGRPALVRASAAQRVPLPKDVRGAALDLELVLRAQEAERPIVHVRKVLHHAPWRGWAAPDAAVNPPSASPEGLACLGALGAHLERKGQGGTAKANPLGPRGRIVDYPVGGEALVSIVIPNKDAAPMLRACVESILTRSTYENLEIVVVENNSEDPATFALYDELGQDPRIRVATYEGPFNFSAICNAGAREARGSHLLFLNNDIEVEEPRWLELMLAPFAEGDVGATGARLAYKDELLQHAGVAMELSGPVHVEQSVPPGYDSYLGLTNRHAHEAIAATGACLLVERRRFEELGGFDEAYPVAYNDVDLCLRLRERGLRIVVDPRVRLLHYESFSRGLDYDDRKKIGRLLSESGQLSRRWTPYYALGDPYYDHRYLVDSLYFELGWVPSHAPLED